MKEGRASLIFTYNDAMKYVQNPSFLPFTYQSKPEATYNLILYIHIPLTTRHK